MASVTDSLGVVGQQGTQASASGISSSKADQFSSLDMSQFLDMMIAELSNQDPMEPMSNAEIMAQLTQLSAIDANRKLTGTLDSVLLGQNVSTASQMIGQLVQAMTASGESVIGKVDSISIQNGEAMLNIGERTVKLSEVAEILSSELVNGDYVVDAEKLLGSTILGRTDSGEVVTGVVDHVSLKDGEVWAHVGAQKIRMSNIDDAVPPGTVILPDGTAIDAKTLIGQQVRATTLQGKPAVGMIEAVNVAAGMTTLMMGENEFTFDQIQEILAPGAKIEVGTLAIMPDDSIQDPGVLLGKPIRGINDAGQEITGTVTAITMKSSGADLTVDGHQVMMGNVLEILDSLPEETDT